MLELKWKLKVFDKVVKVKNKEKDRKMNENWWK